MRITIDGPAGAGKTTTAKAVAKKLGITYVDTGAIYRCVAMKAKKMNPSADAISELMAIGAADEMKEEGLLDMLPDGRIMLDGDDVSGLIRTQEISMLASDVSRYPAVRKYATDFARGLAEGKDVIMEGRDTGSVVLKNAEAKFYLTADLLVRAQRRYKESKEKGQCVNPMEIAADVMKRDEQDMNREHDPLIVPKGAEIIDSTEMQQEEVVAAICRKTSEKIAGMDYGEIRKKVDAAIAAIEKTGFVICRNGICSSTINEERAALCLLRASEEAAKIPIHAESGNEIKILACAYRVMKLLDTAISSLEKAGLSPDPAKEGDAGSCIYAASSASLAMMEGLAGIKDDAGRQMMSDEITKMMDDTSADMYDGVIGMMIQKIIRKIKNG